MKKAETVVRQDMSFLLKELKLEWEKSKSTKQEVMISRQEYEEIGRWLGEAISERQMVLEEREMDFKEAVHLTKENYVLLRLIKKIRQQEQRGKGQYNATAFCVGMDAEEYKLFLFYCR